MKYYAEIFENQIRIQLVEFSTKEERSEWVQKFNASYNAWQLRYEIPYNPNLHIKFIEDEIKPLNEGISINEWMTGKIMEGRLDGNPEKPNSMFATGAYLTGSYALSGTICPTINNNIYITT